MPLIKMTKTHATAKMILLGGRYYNVTPEVMKELKSDRSEGGCFQLVTVKPKGNPRIHQVDAQVDPEDKATNQTVEDYTNDSMGLNTGPA